jgi:hypothetical protein
MAATRKYMVLKCDELRTLLSEQDSYNLAQILGRLDQARMARGVTPPGDFFFVLNMKDKYALAAVEAYVEAIDGDSKNSGEVGVQAARATAMDARGFHIMRCDGEKLPD